MHPLGSWLGVELRYLAALHAVAHQKSFRRAAVTLGLTQSAVSQQIAKLEARVGRRLVDRGTSTQPVALTPVGRVFLSHAEAILARVRMAQAELEVLDRALRVGVFPSVGARLLPRVIRQFTRTSGDACEIEIYEETDDEPLLERLAAGELDVSFVVLPIAEGPFESVELVDDPYTLVVSSASALAGRPSITLQEVARLPLIGFRTGRFAQQIETQFRSRQLDANIVYRSDNCGTIQGLVAAGMAAALVPRLIVDPGDPGLVAVPLSDGPPPRRIGLAWHRDRGASGSGAAFVDTARRVVRARRGGAKTAAAA